MFLRELTSSAICACSALEHHNMDMEIFSSWGLRSPPAASAEIVSAVNHNHLSPSTDACFTFSFLIVEMSLTHCYTYAYIFQQRRKQKPQNNPLKQIFNHRRSLQISKYLHKFNYALSRPRIYCKYNYCDSRTTCNPFCSLTELQLLLLFTDFEKVFPFVNRNLISLCPLLAPSDYLQFRRRHEKAALRKEFFALIRYLEGVLALGDTSLLSLRWPWEGNVLRVHEESRQIQMGKTRAACVRGECGKEFGLLHMLTEKEATGTPRNPDWGSSKRGRQGYKGK